ncbi:hypothetical protein [Thermocatellispora tengchongensis]
MSVTTEIRVDHESAVAHATSVARRAARAAGLPLSWPSTRRSPPPS